MSNIRQRLEAEQKDGQEIVEIGTVPIGDAVSPLTRIQSILYVFSAFMFSAGGSLMICAGFIPMFGARGGNPDMISIGLGCSQIALSITCLGIAFLGTVLTKESE